MTSWDAKVRHWAPSWMCQNYWWRMLLNLLKGMFSLHLSALQLYFCCSPGMITSTMSQTAWPGILFSLGNPSLTSLSHCNASLSLSEDFQLFLQWKQTKCLHLLSRKECLWIFGLASWVIQLFRSFWAELLATSGICSGATWQHMFSQLWIPASVSEIREFTRIFWNVWFSIIYPRIISGVFCVFLWYFT